MNSISSIKAYPFLATGGSLLAGTAVGFGLARLFARRAKPFEGGFDTEYTGAYPRNSGAYNSVVGGSPEDLNGMPATEFPSVEGPIYDGTQLLRGNEP